MKRLVDESTDELTRSLLAAGIEHRPPQGNKATVIVALGAGGALGLFSSNALAWLGTTAGKVTAVGAAVGIAGAVFVAVPALRGDSGQGAGATTSRGASSIAAAPAASERGTDDSEKARAEQSGSRPGSAASSSAASRAAASNAVVAGPESAGRAAALTEPVAGEAQLALGEQRDEQTREPTNAQRAGADGIDAIEGGSVAPPAERKGVRSSARSMSKKRHIARASRSSKRRLAEHEPTVESSQADDAVAAAGADKDRLDAEVRLIDDMHWAARRNDRAALARSVQTYRETFPDGQLKAEAAEFAARLERGDAL